MFSSCFGFTLSFDRGDFGRHERMTSRRKKVVWFQSRNRTITGCRFALFGSFAGPSVRDGSSFSAGDQQRRRARNTGCTSDGNFSAAVEQI
jgi:hypothetical protein